MTKDSFHIFAILRSMEEREKMLLKSLDNRFNRIHGQIRGVQKHLHEDPHDITSLVYQIKAARKALKKISDLLIEERIYDAVNRDEEQVRKLKETLQLFERE